jgi:steroid delta-isomerase-like uncharacterized protein
LQRVIREEDITMSTATDIADRMSDAFKNADVEAFLDCFADDAVQEHPFFPAPGRGRADLLQREGGLFAAFTDIVFEVRTVIEQGDNAAIEGLVSATNTSDMPTPGGVLPATGKRINLPMTSVVRFNADGLIAEERRYMDVAGFMTQLGVGRG